MMHSWITVGVFAFILAGAGCAAPDAPDATSDPSPSAMAQPPTEEALEVKPPPREATRARFRAAMVYAEEEDLASRPIGEIMVTLGERYLGRPYIVGPLDGFGREVVVARLDSFDCFTYVEALLAMARGVASGDTTFTGYLDRTEQQRYRDGEARSYCSRLHYFTEWIYRNAERGIVHDVTTEVGGVSFPKRYGFMTANRSAYPALLADSTFQCITGVEDRLNEAVELYYIPQDRIAASYDLLRPGDIVATATDIEGLDVTHTGLVYRSPDGSVGLLHASTSGGVKVSPDLQTYVQGVDAQVGVIIARPVRPPE